jgi:hypothetical protein
LANGLRVTSPLTKKILLKALLMRSFRRNCSQLFYCCAAVIYHAGYLAYAMVQHEQQQLQQVSTDIPRRQQRKASAGAKQAVLAVLSNSQSISAAAAEDKAVRASKRAALSVDVPAPATDAQRKMVQHLASGDLVRTACWNVCS